MELKPYQQQVTNDLSLFLEQMNVCMKVPTAGGKTFIACNALKPIFDAFDYDQPKAVI